MRIVFVMDSLGTGGAERSTANLWYYLRQHGVEIKIVVLRHRFEGIEKEILEDNFDVVFLDKKSAVQQCYGIHSCIRHFKPDLVHSVLFKSSMRTRMVGLFLRFVHIESLVNCSYDEVRLRDPKVSKMGFYFYKFLDRITSPLTFHFLAISNEVKKHYQRMLNLPERKITVICRGRKENEFVEEKESLKRQYLTELSLVQETMLILHVGRQEFQKGHLVLLEALTKIQMPSKPIAHLFVGREGNNTPAIKKFLKSTEILFPVFWLGHRYDVDKLLAASDLFVFPSRYEGLGGVLIEAQAAVLPIVCTDIPVLHEVVIRNENALMFADGDSQELAVCLQQMIADDELRSLFGQRSLRNYREKFHIDVINEATLNFYQHTLQLVN